MITVELVNSAILMVKLGLLYSLLKPVLSVTLSRILTIYNII